MDVELTQVISLLKSIKKKDRICGLQNVTLLLGRERFCHYLENERGRMNWTDLFSAVHKAVITEIDNGKRISPKTISEMGNVVASVVEKSRGFLDAGSLADAVVQVLECATYNQVIGRSYSDLATGHLLETSYRLEITPDIWTKLTKICVTRYQDQSGSLQKEKYIELLWKTVRWGLHAINVVELLPFLRETLVSSSVPSAQQHLLLVVNTCLLAVAADARYQVAQFVEAVIPTVAQRYSSGRDYNGFIFQLFSIAVNVHHPHCVGEDDGLAYADNWTVWKQALSEMLKVCETEVMYTCRTGHELPLPQYFVQLLVDLSFLMRSDKVVVTDRSEEERSCSPRPTCGKRKRQSVDVLTQTQKRPKMWCFTWSISNNLIDVKTSDLWFWLTYLDVFMDRHPTAVDEEYIQLVPIVTHLLCEVRRPNALAPLSRSAVKLISRFSCIKMTSETRKVLLSAWEKCYDSLVRSVEKTVFPDLLVVIHEIVRNLPLNYEHLLEIILADCIPANPESIRVVSELVVAGVVKTEEQRCKLAKWTLENLVMPDAAARLILALVIKQFPSESILPANDELQDYQDIYFLVTLKNVTSPKVDDVICQKVSDTEPPSLYLEVSASIIEIAQSRYDSILEKLADDRFNHPVMVECAIFLEFLLLIVNEVWNYPANSLQIELLVNIKRLFGRLTSVLAFVLESNSLISLEAVAHLYALDLHPELHLILRSSQCTQSSFVQTVLAVFERHFYSKKSGDLASFILEEVPPCLKYWAPFDKLKLTSTRTETAHCAEKYGRDEFELRGADLTCAKQASEMLAQYLRVPGTTELVDSSLVFGIIRFLSESASPQKKHNSPAQLKLIVKTVHSLLCCHLDAAQVADCFVVIWDICSLRHTDTRMLTMLLVVLEDRLPHFKNRINDGAAEDLLNIMKGFRRVLKKNNHLPLEMASAYIRVLTVMCSIPTLSCRKWSDSEDLMVTDIIPYISRPWVQIRVVASQGIAALLHIEPANTQWHRSVMELIEVSLNRNTTDDAYQKLAFSATSLIVLANAFTSSRPRRLSIANCIVKFVRDNECSASVINNLLDYCSLMLSVDDSSKYLAKHLKDLCINWLQEGRSLKEFPYQLLRTTSLQHFIKTYLAVISAACFLLQKLDVLEEVARLIGLTVNKALEDGYPLINARASSVILSRMEKYISHGKFQELQESRLHEFIHAVVTETNVPPEEFLERAFERSSVVQNVLLMLEEGIVDSVTEEDRIAAFTSYQTVVEHYFNNRQLNHSYTSNAIPSSQSSCCNTYVFRDSVSVVLRQMKSRCTEDMLTMACRFLKNIMEFCFAIPNFKDDILILLPDIVNTLVAVTTGRGNAALQLLRYLMVDCRDVLYDGIVQLDPFPDELQFAELYVPTTLDLHQELHRTVQGYKGRRVAGLARLLKALETQKEELIKMYRKAHTFEGMGYYGKLLQGAVHQLVELCRHSDQAVRNEAAKCLGELGPADLGMLVTSSKDIENATFEPVDLRLVDSLTTHLKVLIETEGVEVKKAACAAMYAVMRFPSLDSECSSFFAPFRHPNIQCMQIKVTTNTSPPNSVWMAECETSHDVWVQNLSISLLDLLDDSVGVIKLLTCLCRLHVPTAHFLLPFVLEINLTCGPLSLKREITSSINHLLRAYLTGKSGITSQSMLSVVNALDYIRCYSFRANNFDCLPEVNKLLMAEVAAECGAHFVSMMYAELWFEDYKDTRYSKDRSAWRLTIDECGEDGASLSRIMRDAFVNVGIVDGLLGCGWSHLADQAQLVAHMERIGRWDLALIGYDVTANQAGIARSLRHRGMLSTISKLSKSNEDSLSCAAILGDWTVLPSRELPPSFHLHHYSALKALHQQDFSCAMLDIDKATKLVVGHFRDGKMNSSRDMYRSLSYLQCLKQLRDIINAKSQEAVLTLGRKWSLQDKLKPSDFSLLEDIVTTRCVAISEVARCDTHLGWNDELGNMRLRLCKLARVAGRNDVVLRNTLQIARSEGVSNGVLNEAKVEEAQYYWAKGEQKSAMFLLNRLVVGSLANSDDLELYAKCLRIYGDWMVETNAENPQKITENYFIKSEQLATEHRNRLEACASLAKFSDSNYIRRKEYRESPEYKSRLESILQRKIAFRERNPEQSREKQIAISVGKKEADIDEKELASLDAELKLFLGHAVSYYGRSLELGERYDHFVFRLISLWLNCPPWALDAVTNEMKTLLPRVPSHKFVGLLPQIAPRMHEFPLLKSIVERSLSEHPHHTLPIVMSLRHVNLDSDEVAETPEGMRVAHSILVEAMKTSALAAIILGMGRFSSAMVQLANHTITQKRPGSYEIPSHIYEKMGDLSNVLMPTITLRAQPQTPTDDIVCIHSLNTTFELVGGINAPKKVDITGTDGRKRTILVKGRDDPRLDAVIQQLFQVVNEVLSRDEAAAQRQLRLRTYRVMPLSRRSGIIEWCDNTQPIGQYLVGTPNGGAHVRFRPQDIAPQEARGQMVKLSQMDAKDKLEAFLRICIKIKPVFHYFFLEKFPSAGMAFEKRLAYTRSVAASSMVGYVMGLGDRHVQNILIDNLSGEVIHIDFGIAFEHGRTLTTPETVPFRLTRDIVDGMGVCGVDGVFRVSCQQTMTVLRQHKDVMLTLLEVLLYDPHYLWALQHDHVPADQPSTSSQVKNKPSINSVAHRALQRVTGKILGTEGGGLATTVEGQVNGLLQSAQDPSNLSKLFAGWQPYL